MFDFIINNVNDEQHNKIIEAINSDAVTKERYLYEKRKYDVERYLDNDMSIGERCEIEELLKINDSLYEHFELSKDVNDSLKIGIFKERLNKIHNELYNPDHINKPEKLDDDVSLIKEISPVRKLKLNTLRIGKWVAAASIVFMIGFGGVNTYLNNRDSLENRMYAKYYEPYSQVSAHLFNSSKLSEAKRQYGEGEYATALLLLDNLEDVLLVQNEKHLYSGMSLMELNRHKEAIEMFKKLHPSAGNETDVLIGYWYIGLCYLKAGDTDNAVKYFNIIIDNNGYNKKQAEQILKRLN
jgi:tetratricopeptide (TPR) repeat protein